MKLALCIAAGLVISTLPAPAAADDTFEARARDAIRVRRLDDLVWALFATCERGDAVQQRQCRLVRDRKARTLRGATLRVDGDAAGFVLGGWSAAKKSVPVTLAACIHCGGVELDGRRWHVVGSVPPPRLEGGTLRAGLLHDNVKTFSDEAAANAWIKSLAGVRVEYLVKVPEQRRWPIAGTEGLLLEIVGYRVFSPCDGGVALSSPPSQNLPADPKACKTAGAPVSKVKLPQGT